MVDTTVCHCCEEQTHHITFNTMDMTFDGESFTAHLTEDEATALYLCLRERLLGLDNIQSLHPTARYSK